MMKIKHIKLKTHHCIFREKVIDVSNYILKQSIKKNPESRRKDLIKK